MGTTFNIGGNVRRLREARGISLSALARQAGISKAYLSQMENDPTKRPSVEIVYQLAQALGVRLTELIGLDEPDPREPAPQNPGPRAGTGATGGPADGNARHGTLNGWRPSDDASDCASGTAADAATTADPGRLPPGLRIFWSEHPHLPLEDIRLLASVAHAITSSPLSPTDYWLLYETLRFLRRPRSGQRALPV